MQKKREVPKDECIALYRDKWTLKMLGRRYGVHAQTILNRMNEWGEERRGSADYKRGVPHSKEHRERIGNALRGRELPKATRRKISEATKGRVPWTKGLRKSTHPSIVKWGVRGEKHWNWKGGIAAKNAVIRNSSKYRAWRDEVFRRDNWTCQLCGQKGGWLEADHIKWFCDYPELRFSVRNGRTLCRECHKKETKKERRRRQRCSA